MYAWCCLWPRSLVPSWEIRPLSLLLQWLHPHCWALWRPLAYGVSLGSLDALHSLWILSFLVFLQDTQPPPIIPTPARKFGKFTVLTHGLLLTWKTHLSGTEGAESAFWSRCLNQKPHVPKPIAETKLSPCIQTVLNHRAPWHQSLKLRRQSFLSSPFALLVVKPRSQ